MTRKSGEGRGADWEPRKSSRVVGSRARGSSVTIGMTMTGNLRVAARRADVRLPRHRPPCWGVATRPTGFVMSDLLEVAERTQQIPVLLEDYLARETPGKRTG